MTTVATFTLTSATAQAAAPFAIGHAFKQGDVPAGVQLVAGFPDFQVTPKNVWEDGSLKFALVAGRATLAAGVPLTVTMSTGTPAGGTTLTTADLKATGVTAAVGCGAFGTASWATTDWDTPFDTTTGLSSSSAAPIVSGPKMSSWFYRKPVGSDPHLVAWLEVRLWAGGEVEILPWIENGYLKVASPTNKAATYTFTLGGTQRFTAALDLLNHTRTVLVSGSVFSHWLGTDPGVRPNHDKAYFQASKLVPKYRAVTPSSARFTALPLTYTPFMQGSYSPSMGAPGYHPSIGLLPEWDMMYLVSDDARTYAGIITNGYGAGRFGIHFRDETTNRPIKFSSYPKLVCEATSGVVHTGLSSTNDSTPAATGTVPPAWSDTHCPSVGFMAYLVTGRFYFAEQMQFAATVNYLLNGNTNRQDSLGIFLSASGSNTTRGAAWANRTLAQAAALTPDSDPLQAELTASLAANIDWNHATYVAQSNNPQGFVRPYSDYTSPTIFNAPITAGSSTVVFPSGYVFLTDGYYIGYQLAIGADVRTITGYVGATRTATVDRPFDTTGTVSMSVRTDNTYYEATWMQDFYTMAFGYMIDLAAPVISTIKTKLAAFFQWKAKSIVGRFGGTGPTEYLYSDAGVYNIAVAPDDAANWATGAGPWYANFGQIYQATLGTANPGVDPGVLRGGNYPEASSYWGNLQPALAYAVQHDVPGAIEGMNRMTSASNWNSLVTAFNDTPLWAVEPHSIGAVAGASMPAIQGRTTLVTDGNRWPGLTVVSSTGGMGPLAQEIPAGGTDGNSPLYGWLDGTDTDYEVSWTVVTGLTSAGTLHTEEDGGMDYSDAANSFTAQAWKGGTRVGSAQTITLGTPSYTITGVTVTPATLSAAGGATGTLSAVVNGTNSPPQTVGWTITAGSIHPSSGAYTLPAATGSTQTVTATATAADGTTVGTCVFTIAAAVVADTTGPTMVGPIAITAVTTTSFRGDWPAATDANGIAEYKYRLNGAGLVSTGLNRFKVFSTLSDDTDYTLEVLAYDPAGNPTAAPLSIVAHTDAIAPVVATGVTLTGPTSGDVGVASTNFSLGVTPAGSSIPGTVRITPTSTIVGDTFTPAYRDVADGAPTGTFTFLPSTVGARTIGATNDSGLTDPTGITYTAAAVAVPDTTGLAVSLADAAATLRLDSDVLAAVTPQLASMIRAITQEAEHEVGRVFITRQVKQSFGSFPRHGEEIQLDIAPAISVESIEYRNGQGAWQTVDPQSYELEEDSAPALIALVADTGWPSAQVRKKAVRVNFTAGYGPTSATVPECAQQYILLRLAEIWDPASREFKMTAASEFAPRLLDSLKVYA